MTEQEIAEIIKRHCCAVLISKPGYVIDTSHFDVAVHGIDEAAAEILRKRNFGYGETRLA